MFRKINDFDGDGKADFAVTRNIGGTKYWYVWQSTAGFRVFPWGLDSDKQAAGDFDGDGKTDFGISRIITPSNNHQVFYAHRGATNDYYVVNFFTPQTVPFTETIQQDYDGDGKSDPAFFFKYDNVTCCRTVFVYESSHNGSFANYLTDVNASFLRIGDLTGDGQSDIVSLNTTNNVLTIENYATRASYTVQFGTTGDQFVPADFDGDGKGDIAIFRESNGTWWWKRSSDGVVNAAQFGQPGDKPVPADYDGDGKTDLAIWRPDASQSVYWVYGSTGSIMGIPFGIATDKVVTY